MYYTLSYISRLNRSCMQRHSCSVSTMKEVRWRGVGRSRRRCPHAFPNNQYACCGNGYGAYREVEAHVVIGLFLLLRKGLRGVRCTLGQLDTVSTAGTEGYGDWYVRVQKAPRCCSTLH
jgi:hypothetical protein